MGKARLNTELNFKIKESLNNVEPSNFLGYIGIRDAFFFIPRIIPILSNIPLPGGKC